MKQIYHIMRAVMFMLLLPLALQMGAQTQTWYNGIHYEVTSDRTVRVIDSQNNGYSGVIEIPELITMDATNGYGEQFKAVYLVTAIGMNAFRDCTGLTAITLPGTVTTIGKNAFYGCIGLTRVTIPRGVSSIESSAFGYCTGLTDIVLPNSVMTMGDNVFYGCTSLANVTLSRSLTSLVNTFQGCTDLQSIDIPANVKVLDGTFHGCSSLSNVILPKSIRVIGANTFDGCVALTEIWLPNTLEQIGARAFAETALTRLELPNTFKSLGEDAFYGCTSLMDITVRSVEPPTMVNLETFSDRTYNNATLLFPSISIDEYETAEWWSHFRNYTNMPDLEAPYDFEVDGIYYLVTARATVDVVCKDMNYNSYSGTVNIPATVSNGPATFNVRAIGNSAFRNCPDLVAVNIPASVTMIGSHAFEGCSGLTRIDIPEAVTAIGDSAFYACTGLTSLTIPVNVSTIGSDALAAIPVQSFTWNARDCWTNGDMNTSGITQVDIGDEVQVLPDRFAYQSGITSVTLPSTLTTIGCEAFLGCGGLTALTVPEEVTSIGIDAFRSTGISSLTWNARNCWSNGCPLPVYYAYMPLRQVTIGNEVKVLPDGFAISAGISSLTIPSSVRYIGDMAFYFCRNLTELVIPDSVINIGDYAFWDCYNLRQVTIGRNVCSIGSGSFSGLTALGSLTWNARWCESMGSMNYESNDLTEVEIGDGVELIPNGFARYSEITSVDIPASVTTIGMYALSATHLTSLFIPHSVTTIRDYAFESCNRYLESIVVENGNPNYDSRNNCNALLLTGRDSLLVTCMNTVIPPEVTVIPDYAFGGVQGLRNIEIPAGVTKIGNRAFSGCNHLTNIVIPAAVKKIGYYAFAGCSALETMRVESGNTVYDSRGDCQAIVETETATLLAGCKNTVIPSSVKTIGDRAFGSCSGLTSIVIPDSVTTIKYNAFEYCSQLKDVTIGSMVQSIGSDAFYGCRNLETVTCLAMTPPQAYESSFYIYWEWVGHYSFTRATLRVPQAALEAYMADATWSKFEQIEAIPGSGPGDLNGDGALDISDITVLIDLVLRGSADLPSYADVNGDGRVDISDIVALIDRVLNG